jgi:site-specific DNA-methyltransferase (adenine-specific)
MIEKNKVHVGDTIETMKLIEEKIIQSIVTSPPYRASIRDDNHKYPDAKGVINDDQTEEEYIQWMVDIFKEYERILKDDGTIAFNISYTTHAPSLIYHVINAIFQNTGFMISDTLSWKKSSCVPLAGHPTAMTRVVEPVYIFVKKDFFNKTKANKVVKSISDTGQKFYTAYYNYLEVKNNDGKIKGHSATYSTDFASYFINLYSNVGDLILDNFMGTGTTGVACKDLKRDYIGIDLFYKYAKDSQDRIDNHVVTNDIMVTLRDVNSSEELELDLYHKNIPNIGDAFLFDKRVMKVSNVKKDGIKYTIELDRERITQKLMDKYPQYHQFYDRWLKVRKISDEQLEYAKDDATTFLRFSKRCMRDEPFWEKVQQLTV